jgi:putative endopeptidase
MMNRSWLRRSLVSIGLAGGLIAGTASALTATDMDRNADPRVDFLRYANGGWLDRNEIKPDRAAVDSFSEADDKLTASLLSLLQGTPQPAGSDQAKAQQLFAQGIDIAARDRAGLAPIADILDRIKKANNKSKLFRLLSTHPSDPYGFFSFGALPSFDDPTRNVAWVNGPTLGLGDRDNYLLTDVATKELQQAYIENSAKLLVLLGTSSSRATAQAKAVFALEKKLAALTADPLAIQADISIVNNPRSITQLQQLFPIIDWSALFAAAGVKDPGMVTVSELDYITKGAAIVRQASTSTLQAWMRLQTISTYSSVLTSKIEATAFELVQLQFGVDAQRPINERVLGAVNSTMPDAVGQLYVDANFSPEAKAEIERLTADVLAAFRVRLQNNAWMSEPTRSKALEKLDKIKVRVGYPDRWVSYGDVALGSSYGATQRNLNDAAARNNFAGIGTPVDNSNWGPVALVNAFYDPTNNSITFPAGILQAPFFDPNGDPASNYGAIGYVIGHEITHGFDLTGSQFDGDGRLVSWFTDEDRNKFVEINTALIGQYNGLSIAPELNVDGELTVGENAADLGGIQSAFDALNARLSTQSVGQLDDLSQQQRFFVAAAQVWRSKVRPEYAELLLQFDPHSPDSIRAVQPSRNTKAFHDAFSIVPGDAMYLVPEARITLW